jgi:hypothetical protein
MSNRQYAFGFFTGILFFFSGSSWCYGNDGGHAVRLNFINAKVILLASDTIPLVKKIPESKTDSASSTVKAVPKARKQSAPIAIAVQPIKVIRPKIIKPVIKIK